MPAKQRNVGIAGALPALISAILLGAMPVAHADDCSGIACLFQGHGHAGAAEPAPQPQAAAPQAAPPAAAATAVAQSTDGVTSAKERSRPKPIATVIMAADAGEMARLKPVAALVARPRVRFVDAEAGRGADFIVATSLDRGDGIQRAKLFTEAMHVVAGGAIHSLDDLKGKPVSFGRDGSAGQAVARKAFAAAGIAVSEIPLDLDNALDGLATGDIAAVVVVAPQPDARLSRLRGGGLHLVSWPRTTTLPEGAGVTSIESATYPGLVAPSAPVAALAVDALLIESRKAHRQVAAAFLGALSQRTALLGKSGYGVLAADLAARAGRRVAANEAR